MVYSTVDGNNDLEEETREFADIRNPNLESEMEEFPHDYFWVSLKNFWLFGPLYEKLQLFWDLIWTMDCLWASSLNENEIVKDAYGWCLEISMT